jgi:hypothetical protein
MQTCGRELGKEMTLWELRESFEKSLPWWIVFGGPAIALAALLLNMILYLFKKLYGKNSP